MSGKKDLIVEKGATLNLAFTWSTKDQNNVKTPVNLTGYSAKLQMRETYDSATSANAAISFSTTPTTAQGTITLGGTAGTIIVTATAAQTSAITIDSGVWDLELTDGTGVVTRLLEGKVTFTPESTKI